MVAVVTVVAALEAVAPMGVVDWVEAGEAGWAEEEAATGSNQEETEVDAMVVALAAVCGVVRAEEMEARAEAVGVAVVRVAAMAAETVVATEAEGGVGATAAGARVGERAVVARVAD